MEGKKKITIGIPAYNGLAPESQLDYLRFAFYLGRFYPEYLFFIAMIPKLEQFRARNNIVEGAISIGSDYLLMLDDDMIIDTENGTAPSDRYGFLRTLIGHMEANPRMGICGVLYWQRGGSYHPVLWKKGDDGNFYWLKEEEVENRLQPCAVVGGGCLLINCAIFARVPSPWFEKELEMGTDAQICRKTTEAGFEVWADTSIELGHVSLHREIVTGRNRHKGLEETQRFTSRASEDWERNSMMHLYNIDVEDYLKLTPGAIAELARTYLSRQAKCREWADPRDYYAGMGTEQLARQYVFHNQAGYGTGAMINMLHAMFDGRKLRGCDFGCGSSPVGFELAMGGHHVDFIDIDGAGAYEFTKWRARKRNVDAGFAPGGPYDYVLCFDSIEHLADWQTDLHALLNALKDGGYLITNFFQNEDFGNEEHITMNKAGVRDLLINHHVYPRKDNLVWQKQQDL